METINYDRLRQLHLGKKLSQLRESQNKSAVQIAKALNYSSRRSVYNYEDRNNLDFHSILDYCEFYQVKLEDFIELNVQDNYTAKEHVATVKVPSIAELDQRLKALEIAFSKLQMQ